MGKYTDVSHDGIEAFCTYGEGPGNLTWGSNVLPLNVSGRNYHGLYLSFAYVDNPASIYFNKHIAIAQVLELANTAIFIICEDNHVELRTGAYGTNPCLVNRYGNVVQQIDGFHYTFNGEVRTIPLIEGTSQGFAYWINSQEVEWMDNVIGNNTPIYGGHKFVRAFVIEGWVFGQSLEDNIIAYEKLTGRVYQVTLAKTQVAPRGNVVNGKAIAAISEPGFFVYENEFVLISEEPPIEDPFKKNVLKKLDNQLNAVEIAYLKQLVEGDM